ncbi:helix-turn-helix transcriptional regulator [Salmonella enterica]|nr:helix-turn-helix transcriptional regulator [Salmonella enterica]EHV2061170.1 helix-turn-helix transcriptional regulator [Salmonella enterica]
MIMKEGKPSLLNAQESAPTIEYYIDNPVIPVCGGIALVKDLEHRFVASNCVFSQFSGVCPKKLQGLCDYDMPWAEQSDIYISHEKAILAGETYKVIEPLIGCTKSLIYTSKEIIYDLRGRPAGTSAMALILDGTVEFNNLVSTSRIQRVSAYGEFKLSPMEAKVLYNYLHGLKRTTISTMLNISIPTVDTYFRRIRVKFNVSSNVELVEMCIKNGYHEVFPFQMVVDL